MSSLRFGVPAAIVCLTATSSFAAPVGFSSLPIGTVLSNQLQSQGVVFQPYYGVQGTVTASSAGNVAIFNYAPGVEFPPSGALVSFGTPHNSVSVHVGDAPGTAATIMTLNALDAAGNVIGTNAATVTPASGFSTQLSVTSGAQNIASMTVVATIDADTSWVVISDINWADNAGGPDFSLSASFGVEVIAGQSALVPIAIERVGGSTGAISFSTSNTPAGVSSTFVPNPSSLSPQLILAASPSAPTSHSIVTITGTPSSPSVGPAPRTLPLYVDVVPPVTVAGGALVDLSTCKPGGPMGTVAQTFLIQRASAVAGPLNVDVEGLPKAVTALISPATLTFPNGELSQSVTVTFTAVGGVAVNDALASLHITGNGVDQGFAFIVFGTCPRQQMDFVARGAWFCETPTLAGPFTFPMQHAVVEFFRHRSDWYDDKVGEVTTAQDGTYSLALWAGEPGDYYARVHTDDHLGAHLNLWWESSFWSIDSEHISNTNPLIDFGAIVISRDGGSGVPYCAIWNGAHQAHENLKQTTGSYWPVYDYSIVLQDTPGLVPWSQLGTTNWPDGYQTSYFDATEGDPFENFEINVHEFGHTVRQSIDGNYTHFTNDSSLYTYARTHEYCLGPSPGPRNQGFAFNEGWAEYWSTEVEGCINLDTAIEGDVAWDLGQMENCAGVGRLGMFKVLVRAGQNKIHSDAEFRHYYHLLYPMCPLPIVSSGCSVAHGKMDSADKPVVPHLDVQKRIETVKRALESQRKTTAALQKQQQDAGEKAKLPGACSSKSCESVAAVLSLPSSLSGRVQVSQLLEQQYAAELDTLTKGLDPNSMFDPRTAFARRQHQLEVETARRKIAHDSLASAAAAIRARESEYPNSDLPNYRAGIERHVRLLDAHSVDDDSLTSFVSIRSAGDSNATKRLPLGTTFQKPTRHRPHSRWWLFLVIGGVIVLIMVRRRSRRR